MIDRQQPAAGLGLGQPVVGVAAEVDPADLTQRVGVPAVGGHLLARQQRDAVPAGRPGQFGVLADRVVIGDSQEVQAALGGQRGQFRYGQPSVGVHGVRVQVARQPLPAGTGRQVPLRRPLPGRRRGRGSGRQQARGVRRGLRGYPVAHAVRRDAVHADHHLPDPGLELARQVSGCGPVRGDDERPARPARPAAEPVRPQAAQVEYGAPGPVVLQLDPQPGGPRPHLHRQVMPRRGEPVLERPPPVVRSLAVARSARHAVHPTRSSRCPPNPGRSPGPPAAGRSAWRAAAGLVSVGGGRGPGQRDGAAGQRGRAGAG